MNQEKEKFQLTNWEIVSVNPIDKKEVISAQFHYINRIKCSKDINKELYKITTKYINIIKKYKRIFFYNFNIR